MDTPGREVEEITRRNRILGHQLHDAMLLHSLLVLLGGDGAVKADTQAGTLIGAHHIPQLALATAGMALTSQLIVRMHLDRKILAGIDKLDQQRELLAKTGIVGLAHELLPLAHEQLTECKATIGSLGHDRLVARKTRQLPALADLSLGSHQTFIGGNALATPHGALQKGVKFQHLNSFRHVIPRTTAPIKKQRYNYFSIFQKRGRPRPRSRPPSKFSKPPIRTSKGRSP